MLPGDVVAFNAPNGTAMETIVPDGIGEGDVFEVTLQQHSEPSREARSDSRSLVLALVEHATRVVNSAIMAGFFEARCHLFDQSESELASGAGETHEQYLAFQEFEEQLDRHFDAFVATRGFQSAADCFATIDLAVVEDLAQQQQEREKLAARLRQVQREAQQHGNQSRHGRAVAEHDDVGGSDASDAASDFSDDDDDGLEALLPLIGLEGNGATRNESASGSSSEGSSGGSGSLDPAALTLFSQPVALDDLIAHALTLAEYPTFSRLMRQKAAERSQRREWIRGWDSRLCAATQQLEVLGLHPTPRAGTAPLVDAVVWSALSKRIQDLEPLAAVASGTAPPPLTSQLARRIRDEEERLLAKFEAVGDAPPATAEEKRELWVLLGVPLSRLARAVPAVCTPVEAGLAKNRQIIDESTRLGQQRSCAELFMEGVHAAHDLVGQAEAIMDAAVQEAELRAEARRREYEDGMQEE